MTISSGGRTSRRGGAWASTSRSRAKAMPIFQYQDYRNPYGPSIAEALQRQADPQAAGALRAGDIAARGAPRAAVRGDRRDSGGHPGAAGGRAADGAAGAGDANGRPAT